MNNYLTAGTLYLTSLPAITGFDSVLSKRCSDNIKWLIIYLFHSFLILCTFLLCIASIHHKVLGTRKRICRKRSVKDINRTTSNLLTYVLNSFSV